MNYYFIGGIVIMVAVLAILILAMRIYQKQRVSTGYQTGKFYQRGQHMGAFIGNYHMNEIGVGEEYSGQKVDQDEEMFLFSAADKEKTE